MEIKPEWRFAAYRAATAPLIHNAALEAAARKCELEGDQRADQEQVGLALLLAEEIRKMKDRPRFRPAR